MLDHEHTPRRTGVGAGRKRQDRDLAQREVHELDSSPRLRELRKHVANALRKGGHARALVDRRRLKSLGPDERPLAKTRRRRNAAQTAAQMLDCGKVPSVVARKGKNVERIYLRQCRSLLCPRCAKLRAAALRVRLGRVIQELIKERERFSLITLTLPHTRQDSLELLVEILNNALRVFTRCKEFKTHVRGYVRAVETTRKQRGYHVHAHLFVAAGFWPMDEIKRCWIDIVRKVSGRVVTPNGVDVRGLMDAGKGLSEVVGYCVKFLDLARYSRDEIVELWRVLKGRHMVQCCRKWGKLAKKLEAQAIEQAEAKAKEAGDEQLELLRFVDLVKDVRAGKPDAVETCQQVIRYLVKTGLPKVAALVSDIVAAPGVWLRRERRLHGPRGPDQLASRAHPGRVGFQPSLLVLNSPPCGSLLPARL